MQQLLDRLIKQKPVKSDVIVWLQGDRLDRGRQVWELYQQGFAPLIFVTGNNKLIGLGPRPGENDMPINEIQTWLRKQGVPSAAIIVDDQALNTWEQAVNTIRLALENDWQRLLLVTSPYHQARAFLTFLKAMRAGDWNGKIINQPAAYLAWDKQPGGRDQQANELLADELDKITRYKDHVASWADGLNHLASL